MVAGKLPEGKKQLTVVFLRLDESITVFESCNKSLGGRREEGEKRGKEGGEKERRGGKEEGRKKEERKERRGGEEGRVEDRRGELHYYKIACAPAYSKSNVPGSLHDRDVNSISQSIKAPDSHAKLHHVSKLQEF